MRRPGTDREVMKGSLRPDTSHGCEMSFIALFRADLHISIQIFNVPMDQVLFLSTDISSSLELMELELCTVF